MLSKIGFVAGAKRGAAPLEVEGKRFTVLIGPNNSGKSLALQELYARARVNPWDKIGFDSVIASVGLQKPKTADQFISRVSRNSPPYKDQGRSIVRIRDANAIYDYPLDQLRQWYEHEQQWSAALGLASTLWIDGATRLSLLAQQHLGNLKEPGVGSIQTLFRDGAARGLLRECLHRAFGKYFVIDPTDNFCGQARLADVPPASDYVEQGLHQEAIEYHRAAQSIASFSDGVRAYAGILAAVVASESGLVLIDEPEAFLHPSLSRTLGHELAQIGRGRDVSYVVATHSSEFLAGCIESGADVQVVRLTWDGSAGTARALDSDAIRSAMRDPLLRSLQTTNALFASGCVVGEADTDRVFYQEIHYRLGEGRSRAREVMFLNAQNKQTVRRVLAWLRTAGVPAAAVLDLDVIKDGGKEWTGLLGAASVPSALHDGFALHRSRIKAAYEMNHIDPKRAGIAGLCDGDRLAAESLLEQLAQFGLFVVPVGEVERWLHHAGVAGHGPEWLLKVFEYLGGDPAKEGYIYPAAEDVWEFVCEVSRWIENPDRKGMP